MHRTAGNTQDRRRWNCGRREESERDQKA
ncbi:hypothetical protein A2U01_0055400, partial [Trifolium medium]|nr:hypothetical protein [Trifolium medium]